MHMLLELPQRAHSVINWPGLPSSVSVSVECRDVQQCNVDHAAAGMSPCSTGRNSRGMTTTEALEVDA